MWQIYKLLEAQGQTFLKSRPQHKGWQAYSVRLLRNSRLKPMQVSFQYRLKFNEVYDLYSTLGANYESKLEPLSAQGWGMLGSPEFRAEEFKI